MLKILKIILLTALILTIIRWNFKKENKDTSYSSENNFLFMDQDYLAHLSDAVPPSDKQQSETDFSHISSPRKK